MLKIIKKTYLLIAILSIAGSIIFYLYVAYQDSNTQNPYDGMFKILILIFNLIFLILSSSIFLNLFKEIRENIFLRLISFYLPVLIILLGKIFMSGFTSKDFKGFILYIPYVLAFTIGYFYFIKKMSKNEPEQTN